MTTPSDKPSVVKDLRYGDLCPRCNAASGIDTCGSPDDECPIAVDVLPENYYIPRSAVPETGTHTDHPLRHFDRTCPACTEGDTPRTDAPACDFKHRLLCPRDAWQTARIEQLERHCAAWKLLAKQNEETAADALRQRDEARLAIEGMRGPLANAVALSAIGQRTELTGGGSASLNGWPGNRGTAPQGVQECRENSGAADGGERPAPLSTTQPRLTVGTPEWREWLDVQADAKFIIGYTGTRDDLQAVAEKAQRIADIAAKHTTGKSTASATQERKP